jgi:hypothetical protein
MKMRAILLAAVLICAGLVGYGIARYPAVVTDSPGATAVLLPVLALLLAGYAIVTVLFTRRTGPQWRVGARTGVIVAGCWAVEVTAGNVLGDHAWVRVLYMAANIGVLVATLAGGVIAGARNRRLGAGVLAGVYSGVIGAMVPLIELLALAYLFPGLVGSDPQNIAEAARSHTGSVLQFAVGDDMVAGISHLLLGPALGALLGTLGGAIGLALPARPGPDQAASTSQVSMSA